MDRLCLSQDIYDHIPRQRQLDEHERIEAENYLRLKVDKKLLQQHLSDQTGKVVTLKDVQTGVRESSDKNNLEALTARLRSIAGK